MGDGKGDTPDNSLLTRAHVLTQLGENLSEYFDGLIKDGAFMIHVFAIYFGQFFENTLLLNFSEHSKIAHTRTVGERQAFQTIVL